MIRAHHEKHDSSAVIVPSCGFDSIPSDLGTYLLVTAVQKSSPVKRVRSVILDLAGGISGGTFSTALHIAETYSLKELAETYKPFGISPTAAKVPRQKAILYDNGWLGPWLMGSTNSAIVYRTCGLLNWLPFSYREYLKYDNIFKAIFFRITLAIGPLFLKLSAVRWLARKFGPGIGEGPTEESLRNGRLRMKITADTDEHSGSIHISADQDPAYLLTGIVFRISNSAMMLVESGLVLAREFQNTPVAKMNKPKSVVITPALLGEPLRRRLENGGLHFYLEV